MRSMLRGILKDFESEISKVVIGLKEAKKVLLIGLVSDGHVLLEGSPGLGKTTLAKVFSKAIGAEFKRIQMTPDLLPGDIIGTSYYDLKTGEFKVKKGPIFTNILFVDELNRASPKTQAALLEAMQERQVTIEGVTYNLPRPFMVIATQVPGSIGTYQLTETQIDRFAMSIRMSYPSRDEEIKIISNIDSIEEMRVKQVISIDELIRLQDSSKEVYVDSRVKSYIVEIVNRIREIKELNYPLSPRASIWLYKASRANAILSGREYVIPDDIKEVSRFVFSHRISLSPEAELDTYDIINRVLEEIPVPKS